MGVGSWLRQAREAKGLSIGEVAARTKIPPRHLAALEAEEYEKVPGGIFVRGHLRATATAVGLDPAEVTELFAEETAPPPPPVDDEPGEQGPRLRMAAEPRESRPNRHVVAAVVIGLSLALAIAWFGRDRDVRPSSRNGSLPAARAALTPPGSGVAAGDGPGAVGTMGTMSGEGASHPDGVTFSLEAQRVCWLALRVDGRRMVYRMLKERETLTGRVRHRATVRTGDAEALLLSIDGGPATPLGDAGAVRNVEFTPGDSPLLAR